MLDFFFILACLQCIFILQNQKHLTILKAYIKDLTDQHAIIVKAIEDQETDANARINRLEVKLKSSTDILKVFSPDDVTIQSK